MKTQKQDVVWMQLTAGQGPKECGWVVAQLQQRIMKEAILDRLTIERVEALAFEKMYRKQDLFEPETFLSVLLRVEGRNAKAFAKQWEGAIKWQGESPYRPKHKRINWFVGVVLLDMPEITPINRQQLAKEVKVDTMRASGPGGQHVNKTNSAVRLTHRPSGITVRVETDRSQHRNRQIAMERLQILLSQQLASDKKDYDKQRWLNHYQVARGNPKKRFFGAEFYEKR